MAKLLLFLACLIVPGIWGLIVGSAFVRYVPARWKKEPKFVREEDAGALSENLWDYQI